MIKKYDVRKDSSSVQNNQHRKIMALHRTELRREREKKKKRKNNNLGSHHQLGSKT